MNKTRVRPAKQKAGTSAHTPLKGPLPPENFIEIVNRCKTRKEWGFCKHCRIKVRIIEIDGHDVSGFLDLTIVNSIKLEGHVPFNINRIRSVEFINSSSIAPCAISKNK